MKLNKVEQAIVDQLPEELRAQATSTLLAAKAETEAWVTRNRSEFSVKVNDKGTIVIYGMGNRFPVSFRPEQLQLLLEKIGSITPLIPQALEAQAKYRSQPKAKVTKSRK